MYIGLDVGTSGCKASLIDERGRVVQHRNCEYDLTFPKAGWIEMDPRVVWPAVKEALRGLTGTGEARALAIASFGEAVVLLDAADEVLCNSIFYSDVRGTEEVQDLQQMFDKQWLQTTTGMPVNPMYSINKLLWIKKHQPDILAKARRLMLFGDYILYKLSGERCIDYSLASRTMALDLQGKCWNPQILEALGLAPAAFSRPVLAGEIVGRLRPEVAAETGLSRDLVLVSGGHDQVCAALGSGAIQPGQAVDGMGSSECISVVLDSGMIHPQMFVANYCCEPHAVRDRYVTLAFNNSAGTAIKWYRDTFEQELLQQCGATGRNPYAILDEGCRPEPSGLLFLPHLAGSGTPYMDSLSSGAIIGLNLSSDKRDIYRAILEGLCYEMRFNLETLADCGIHLSSVLTAVGGGAKSPALLQIKADILGIQVQTLQSGESGTMGLVMLCAVAMKDYSDLQQAAEELIRPKQSFSPNPVLRDAYEAKYRQYKRVYEAVKEIYRP